MYQNRIAAVFFKIRWIIHSDFSHPPDILRLVVSLSEYLPSYIRGNPFEDWLISLSFRYTQSQFAP